MWEYFDKLTMENKTIAAIREDFSNLNSTALDEYSDIFLIKRMIRTLRANL